MPAQFRRCLLLLLPLALSASSQTLTQTDLLRRAIDLDRLADPPPIGEENLLFSSWDRRQLEVRDGRFVHWAADNDRAQFLRRDTDGWDVLAEADGPLVVTRLWMDRPAGEMQFIIDGKPLISAPAAELFSGGVAPLGEPLSYRVAADGAGVCYFPIAAARSLIVRTRGFAGAYQIDCTKLPPTTRVESFSPELGETALQVLKEVQDALRNGLSDKQLFGARRLMPISNQLDVEPGKSLVEELAQPGTLRALYVALTDKNEPRDPWALRQVVLRITFDGAAEPQVQAPLCDFFGAGFERNLVSGLALGTDKWTEMPGVNLNESWFMYCLLPMPFASSVKIELLNLSSQKIGLMLYARIERGKPGAERLRFCARFHREPNCKTFDYPLLEATGRGRIVGSVLSIDTPRFAWWGAGDHKLWLDDPARPALLGTGTPDFYAAPAPLSESRRPLHGVSSAGPFGKQSLWRLQLSDCVNFQKSARLTVENLQPDDAEDVDYSSVTWFYASPGAKLPAARNPKREDLLPRPLRIADAIEAEAGILPPGAQVLSEKNAGVELSAQAALSVANDQTFAVRLSAKKAGSYLLRVRVHPRRTFEKIEVARTDGTPLGVVTYRADSGGLYDVGKIELAAGEQEIRARCTRPAVLDCWLLAPLR